MNLNFESNNKQSLKYRKYNIKEINGKSYIVPELENVEEYIDLYDPIKNINNAIVDLINIGEKIAMQDVQDIENDVLDFVNNYGLLGFINDTPVSRKFIIDEEVLIRPGNFVTDNKTMKIKDYLKIFFPLLTDKQLDEKIENCKKIFTLNYRKHEINHRVNEEIYYADDYYEDVSMIISYAYDLFILFCAVKGTEIFSDKEHKKMSYDIVKGFEVMNLNFDLAKSLENNQVKIRWEISSLKQMIDTYFAFIISSDINTIKMCKHCKKIFIGKNPKAEYCSPQCRNQANVYKSRAKNK